MASTTGSVMLRAAAHLNDTNQLVYTAELLAPFLQMALDEMEEEIAVFEIDSFKQTSIAILVPAGSVELPELPTDFVEAVGLFERNQGGSDEWSPVTEKIDLNPNLTVRPAERIIQWTARPTEILINPPSTDREVLLNYIKGFAIIGDDGGESLAIEQSRRLLALLTARNAARDLGNSPTKAGSFDADINRARDRLTRRLQKSSASAAGVRRRPYSGRR